MSDALWLSNHGLSVVVVVHDIFETAARNYLKMRKRELPVLVMPRPLWDWSEEDKIAVIADLLTKARAALKFDSGAISALPTEKEQA